MRTVKKWLCCFPFIACMYAWIHTQRIIRCPHLNTYIKNPSHLSFQILLFRLQLSDVMLWISFKSQVFTCLKIHHFIGWSSPPLESSSEQDDYRLPKTDICLTLKEGIRWWPVLNNLSRLRPKSLGLYSTLSLPIRRFTLHLNEEDFPFFLCLLWLYLEE